ncbi:MAG: 16S rRNA (cytosine(1402)-N(4))-methyltransferase RsmH [Candidatus Hydrogenedentota bacterium]|nr:MAG: 16S rRNA (cytosine(1402)-N(4))-methyltransferase RsmH [Candidatus Hydrogenedentota bacterium]
MTTRHLPVLPALVRNLFLDEPRRVRRILDATCGGGGHARILAEAGHAVIALDRDPRAIEIARENLGDLALPPPSASRQPPNPVPGRVLLLNRCFSDCTDLAPLDGVVADLGLSSDQLADSERGFSFRADGPLDMRMDPRAGRTAAEFIAEGRPEELERILRLYGEERSSRLLARRLSGRSFASAEALAEEIARIVRRSRRIRRGRIHPATRVFQALRIAVNDELGELERFLERLPPLLSPGARVLVITFHSLEDRIVKRVFRNWTRSVPRGSGLFRERSGGTKAEDTVPRACCDRKMSEMKRAVFLWKGVKRADEKERRANPRSRSAKARAVEIITAGYEE